MADDCCRKSVSISANTHCRVSISICRLSRYALLWDWCISLFFCIILLCIISCSDLNDGRVDDCVDDEDPFEFNNVLSLSCKIIRFEAPTRQWGRDNAMIPKLCWLYVYWIILNRKVYYKSYSFCCKQNRLHDTTKTNCCQSLR